jgi:hypothetical protein
MKGWCESFGVQWVSEQKCLTEEISNCISMKCTAWCGRILVIGFAKGSFEKVAVNRVLLKNISLIGLHWYVVVFIKLGTIKACY